MADPAKQISKWMKSQGVDTSFIITYERARGGFVLVLDRGKYGTITRVGSDLGIVVSNTIAATPLDDLPKSHPAKTKQPAKQESSGMPGMSTVSGMPGLG